MKLYDVMRKDEEGVLKAREVERYSPHVPLQKQKKSTTRRKLVIIGVAVVFLSVIYVLGNKIVHAKVVITERRIPFLLNRAQLELTNQEKADSGRLSFQTMVVTTTITRELYGSALTNSNTRATGSVVFFNEYSSAKQTIKKGTILTAPNGKKYQTQAQVIVPGFTTVSKKKVAGTSTSVGIVAMDVGDTYNSSGETLSVAGFSKATKTFYARSAAITGGEAGVSHTLTEAEREHAILTLQAQLIERLKRETRAQIPENLITFPELQLPIIDVNSFVFKGGSVRFPASMTGTMVSYLIPRDMLEQAIAAKAISERSYAKVAIPDLNDLTFDMQSAIPTDPKAVPDAITIAVTGSGTVIAKAPIDKIKEGLLGKPRRSFEEALAGIDEIDSARFKLAPFWSPRFPSSWGKIDISTK